MKKEALPYPCYLWISLSKHTLIDQELYLERVLLNNELTAFATAKQWNKRRLASSCEGRLSWFQNAISPHLASVSQLFPLMSDISGTLLLPAVFLFLLWLEFFFPNIKPADRSMNIYHHKWPHYWLYPCWYANRAMAILS